MRESITSIHDIATLLKLYYRELPSPLIPPCCLRNLLEASSTTNDFSPTVKTVLNQHFPAQHLACLRLLLALLHRVVDHSDRNKMTARNLGVVLAPTLLRESDSEELGLYDIQSGVTLVQKLIEEAPNLFPLDLWEKYPYSSNSKGSSSLSKGA